jgi:hypothetical protein
MADSRQKFDGTPDYSDLSSGPGSTLVGGLSPVSPIRQRPTYQRLPSGAAPDESAYATIPEIDVGGDIAETFQKAPDAQGLGIGTGSSPKKRARRVSIAQTPVVGTSSSSTPAAWTPGSNDPLMSSFGHSGPVSPDRNTLYDPAATYGLGNDDYRANPYKRSQSSIGSTLEPYHPDTENLTKPPATSIRSVKSGRSAYDSKYMDICDNFHQNI